MDNFLNGSTMELEGSATGFRVPHAHFFLYLIPSFSLSFFLFSKNLFLHFHLPFQSSFPLVLRIWFLYCI